MLPLTSSELKSWQTCQRGWWLTFYRQMRRVYDLPSLANVGSLYHLALESYYRSLAEDGPEVDMGKTIKDKTTELLIAYPDYGEQIAKDGELAWIMVEGYEQWLQETGADYGLRIIAAEQMVEVDIDGRFKLRGKIDARAERESDGALLQLEHKTVGALGEIPKYAQAAPQFLTYDLLAYLTKPDGVATDGVIINMARRVKRTARAKPPFYDRFEVRHNVDELRAHWKHIVGVAEQIETARARLDNGEDVHIVCPPSINRSHSWSCSCRDITPMMDDGSDYESFLQEFYQEFDPMERYQDG